jgi:uncharacterized protein
MVAPPVVTRLERDECIWLLSQSSFGRLAVSIGAIPAIRSIKFAVAGDHVVFRLAPSSALCRAASGVVAFQADHYEPETMQSWSVSVTDHCLEVLDESLLAELRTLPLDPWAPEDAADRFFRIALEKVRGERVYWSK